MSRLSNQRGFSLVELVLAMAVFSFVLVIMSGVLVQMLHLYQSGVEIRATQQASRSIADKISEDARSAQTIVAAPNTASSYTHAGATFNTLGRVCMIKSKTVAAGGQFIYTMTVYDVPLGGGYAITNGYSLVRAKEVASAPIDPTVSLATVCGGLTSLGTTETLTTSDTGVLVFMPTDTNGSLLSLRLGIVARNGLTDVEYIDRAEGGVCSLSVGTQYCSITNLVITAGGTQ